VDTRLGCISLPPLALRPFWEARMNLGIDLPGRWLSPILCDWPDPSHGVEGVHDFQELPPLFRGFEGTVSSHDVAGSDAILAFC
jgi:hypothetical protein